MAFKIYTKTGDTGKTSLFGGKRVLKDDERIEAYGTIDELNSFVGLLRDSVERQEIIGQLAKIQNKLFDLGSYLATPEKKKEDSGVTADNILWMEACIDEMDSELPPLKNFILPGGHPHVSYAHLCRTVCRRAERKVVSLDKSSEIDPLVIQYLNRLSDYFFILARSIALQYGVAEIKWSKGE